MAAAEAAEGDAAAEAEAALAEAEARAVADVRTAAACAEHAKALRAVIRDGVEDGSVVVIGECGLDYDRLHFSPARVQRLGFDQQLALAGECGLPLFLHNRNTGGDFSAACADRRAMLSACGGGVVHSYDGGASPRQGAPLPSRPPGLARAEPGPARACCAPRAWRARWAWPGQWRSCCGCQAHR